MAARRMDFSFRESTTTDSLPGTQQLSPVGPMGTQGYVALVVASIANGTFGVLHKQCRCTNDIFVLYFCLGAFLISELTLAFLPAMGKTIEFSPWGLPSGLSQFLAINCGAARCTARSPARPPTRPLPTWSVPL